MNSTLYRERRSLLAQRLREAGGGLAIVMTAPEALRSRDTEHPYRHDSYFHYLTGFDEPQSGLVLRADGHSVLFCRNKDVAHEIWNGHRLGPQAAPQTLGVDEAHAIDQIDSRLPELLNHQSTVWTLFGAPGALEHRHRAVTRHRVPATPLDRQQPHPGWRRIAAGRRRRLFARRTRKADP